MDFGRRKTQKYGFKIPKIEYLKSLGSLVDSLEAFRKKYGALLSLLSTNIKDGILT